MKISEYHILTTGRNPAVAGKPRSQQELPPRNTQVPLSEESGIYNTLSSNTYQHNYTSLSGNLQYNVYRTQTGSVQHERLPGYVYIIPDQQVIVSLCKGN